MKQSSFAQEDSLKKAPRFSRLKRKKKDFQLSVFNVSEFVLSTVYAIATECHEDHYKSTEKQQRTYYYNTIMRQPVRSMLILALC